MSMSGSQPQPKALILDKITRSSHANQRWL